MRDSDTIIGDLAEKWASGKPFREKAAIMERMAKAARNIAEIELTSERATLRFLGGTNVADACAATFDIQLATGLPVVARFNGVEISMSKAAP